MTIPRLRQILVLSLPIMGGMLSQNILNLVDTAMVGQLGSASVAATGLGGFLNFFTISLILGLSAGVQAMAARRMGEGKKSNAAEALNGGIMIALVCGIPLGLLAAWFASNILDLFVRDVQIVDAGVPYLQARLSAAFAVGINFSFRGFWNGIKKSHIYMGTIVFMHVINISLNYLLIFGNFGFPALGTLGAGLASAISVISGSVLYLIMGFLQIRPMGFMKNIPSLKSLSTLIRISLPSGIQQMFFSAGLLTLFLIIEKIGTNELAAANIIVNIMLVGYLPGIALGLGAATLVGHALGRNDVADAKRWGYQVMLVAMVLLAFIGIPMYFFTEIITGLFISGKGSAAVIELARIPLMMTGIIMSIEAVGLVLMNALLGAGDSRTVMYVSIILQWCIFLPIVAILVYSGYELLDVWIAQIVYRIFFAAVFLRVWHKGQWHHTQV